MGTQFISVILLLIAILSIISNPDITQALGIIFSVMSSRNPLIYIPALLLTIFTFLGYIFFFIGWALIVYGEKEIPSASPESINIASVFAFLYLILYLIRVSVSIFTVLGFAPVIMLQELFLGAGMIFNIIDAIFLSLSLLYFARHLAYPTTRYHIRNTCYAYVAGAASSAIGYTILLSGVFFFGASAPLVIAGLVLIYLGYGLMISAIVKFHELYFVIVERIEKEDFVVRARHYW
ncbi:MAG: hypothetical protein ACP5JR_03605 [Thermoplasmata archaeon]